MLAVVVSMAKCSSLEGKLFLGTLLQAANTVRKKLNTNHILFTLIKLLFAAVGVITNSEELNANGKYCQ